jgi:Cu2+-exporting ATPase
VSHHTALTRGAHLPGAGRPEVDGPRSETVVLDVRGIQWASQQNRLTATLLRRPGVLDVAANAVAQTATVRYDATRTSQADLQEWVRDCGFHCAGQSVPAHICDPMDQLGDDHGGHTGHEAAATHSAHEPAQQEGTAAPSPHDVMGHGGHAGGTMASMVKEMRNRFLVAAMFSIPIVLWSPIGKDVFGVNAPVPLGLRADVWTLLLSLPVVFYASWIFFDGAVRALRARTLDMMVLVAVAVGSGWL